MRLSPLFVFLSFTYVNCVIIKIPELGNVLGSTTRTSWTNRTIHQFLSIKYATLPADNRKFGAAVPAEPWTGIYNATVQGNKCPQKSHLQALAIPTEIDVENCLFLNIYTPINPDNVINNTKLLPVLVFIHGGGFFSGNNEEFRPDFFLEKDIILVTIQYRLGLLGSLCLHTDNIAGNMGLLDQVLALEWVNKYIKYFGGDNTHVTLMGHSTGAFSVSAHLLSPAVGPHLFQKTIVQSGAAYAHWGVQTDPIGYAQKIYHRMNNNTNDDSIDVMEKYFMNASVIDLLRAFNDEFDSDYRSSFQVCGAVVQKAGNIKYLTDHPNSMIKKGKPKTMPMLSGVTKHDGSFYSFPLYDMLRSKNLENDDDYLRHNITREILESAKINDLSNAMSNIIYNYYLSDIINTYESITFTKISPAIIDLYSVLGFKSQVLKQVEINAKYEPNTYFYTFDYKGQHNLTNNSVPYDIGVEHGTDLFLMFPINDLNENDTNMAKTMIDLWTSFIINGKPTSERLKIDWPPVSNGKNGSYMHIDVPPSIGYEFSASEFFTAKSNK